MSEPVINVQHVGKRYRLGGKSGPYKTIRESLMGSLSGVSRLFTGAGAPAADSGGNRAGNGAGNGNSFWALKDVSFTVERGDVVGIVGRNGAGKSTLLKVLSRITEPTEGQIEIIGRVGSLLEVGTGFHPELTGRENVYLNGAILGMKRGEIDRKFDEIVAFSEVEKFLDTPVKFYSSGMYMRLAFSVAAHLEPEILIVDEVLAVGDAQFQRKCLGKMSDVAREGRTILFVSHNMTAVGNLCSRAVWLSAGSVKMQGPTADVIGKYLASAESGTTDRTWPGDATAPGDHRVRLRRVAVRPADESASRVISLDTPVEVIIEYENFVEGQRLNVTTLFYTPDETCAFAAASRGTPMPKGIIRNRCVIPGHLLNNHTYAVKAMVVRDENEPLADVDRAVIFEVVEPNRDSDYHGKWPGSLRPQLTWESTPAGVATNG
jgi:lipopolysaccharide transport system ATP-binding protein